MTIKKNKYIKHNFNDNMTDNTTFKLSAKYFKILVPYFCCGVGHRFFFAR